MVSSEGSRGGVVDEQEWPPGFRFHPTDEELVLYYLKRKICRKKLKLNIIAETDVYKWDPEELPGMSLLKTGDRLWFFFSPRDRKYPNGARSNRGTKQGYWKATGKDRTISCGPRTVGLKKTLVFYRGRAPNGERTDWVMHEYTLDEEEFKRCQNVQGYYALYKVYKKSGPGPKNGEQYGAPFREEDWNNDCPDFNNISPEKVDEGLPIARVNVDSQVPLFPDDIEVFMKNLTEDPLFDLPSTSDCMFTPSQGSTAEELLCRDIAVEERVDMFYAGGVQRNLQATFDSTQTLSQNECKVESGAIKMGEPEVYVLPEEDFLEMDDLLGPDPVKENINGFLIDERDGFSEFDLYHDAAMFLNDLGPGPTEPNQLGPGEVVHQLHVQVPAGDFNQSFLQVSDSISDEIYRNNANQFYLYGEPQSQSQEESVLTSAELYHGFDDYSDPTSGLVNESSEGNQNQGLGENSGPTSWLSSAVWSFVESIPTTPASAAENALVNRAFERMSSFSRLRIGAANTIISANSDSVTPKASSVKRGLIFFPVLVAVIAVFWAVFGAVSVRGIALSS